MADELIDIFDENMNMLGTAMKSQAHREGLWHKVFRCWIIKRDGRGRHKIWLQLRGKDKKFYPGLLDASASGHLRAGETAKDGIREIEEELGLKVDFGKLTKLFTRRIAADDCGQCNREFAGVYVLETGKELDDLVMQPEEVDGVYEAEVEDMILLCREKVKFLTIVGCRRRSDNSYAKEVRSVTLKDLVPNSDYLKILDMVQRYFEGKREFAA